MPDFGVITQKRRTNRKLTTHAINAIVRHLKGWSPADWHHTNTKVAVNADGSIVLEVLGNVVLRIAKEEGRFEKVWLYAGMEHDGDSTAARVTRERLNGVLDALGWEGLIPLNVRIWYDKEYGVAYLVHFEDKIALDANYCKAVSIKTHPKEFIACDRQIVKN
jgi:hypothetical protein